MKLHSCYIHKGVQPSDQKLFILGIFSQIQAMGNGNLWEYSRFSLLLAGRDVSPGGIC